MPINDQYKFGGPSALGDYAKAGGEVEELSITAIKNGKFGFWSDYAKKVPVVTIDGTPVETGTEEEAYDGFIVSGAGGVAPYVYSLVGEWPEGITVDADSGEVSGTFAADSAETYADLSVRVTDAWKQTADLASFDIVVGAA
ncbi:putative Ig domain-containing protein [Phyllobacterium sp. SB3]|uniref:putative Ig domain-containing protein n=1 Tax=Phyllobacterium sp. SB3 TaxID=3156073 RepID=UPI0032AE874A